MRRSWSLTAVIILVLIAGIAIGLSWERQTPVLAQPGGVEKMFGPRYSIVETQGHNLIVTDNKLHRLYFYTTDKDAEVGSDLKLRGSIDLDQVGNNTIRPTPARRP